MALSDYYQCGVCGGKTFYDANLDYEHMASGGEFWPEGLPVGAFDMKVLCMACSETHEIKIVKKEN